jgi:hypothetical protein
MKFLALCKVFFIFTSTLSCEILDQIDAVFLKNTDISFLCYSDYWFPVATGMLVSPEEQMIRHLWLQKADEHNLKVGMDGQQEYAEKYLDMLQETQGVSRQEINKMCQQMGYQLSDIKKELNEQYIVQQAIEIVLTAKGLLHISNEDLIDYCKKNPYKIDGTYTFQKGIRENIEEAYEWKDILILKENELSEKFKGAIHQHVGEIVYEVLSDKIHTAYKLIEKIPTKIFDTEYQLENFYETIMQSLQQERYKKAYKQITLELLSSKDIEFKDSIQVERLKKYIEDSL